MTTKLKKKSRFWPYCCWIGGIVSVGWLGINSYAPSIEREMQNSIKAALAERQYPAIPIMVDGRDVTLGGEVNDRVLRATMVDFVENLAGVRIVRDRISISNNNGSSITSSDTEDSQANKKPVIPSRLARLKLVRQEGSVILSGELNQNEDLTALMTALSRAGINNITDVADRTDEVKPAEWLSHLTALSPNLIIMPDAIVEVKDDQFSVDGTVASNGQSQTLLDQLALHLEHFPVEASISVVLDESSELAQNDSDSTDIVAPSPVLTTAWLKVLVDGENNQVSGELAQDQTSDALLAKLKQQLGDFSQENTQIKSNYTNPAWAVAANQMLDAVFGLDSYSLEIKDNKVSLSTQVENDAVKQRLDTRFNQLFNDQDDIQATLDISIKPTDKKVQRAKLEDTLAKIDLKGVKFQYGTTEIRGGSLAILDQVINVLGLYPEITVEIAGHTDSYGDEYPNLSLSQRRAESILSYLSKEGVAKNRMNAKGYGENYPIGDNATELGRSLNRRIEFKF